MSTTIHTTAIDRSILVSRTARSPLGALTLFADEGALVGLYFEQHAPRPRVGPSRGGPSAVLDRAEAELARYFASYEHRFEVPLAARGTDLERSVWSMLARIPIGQTRTYGEIAASLGRAGAARAIGNAVARNPLSIIVPCHRVIGQSGSLTGFAGGIERKAWLLAHEGARVDRARSPRAQYSVPQVFGQVGAAAPDQQGERRERAGGP